MTIFSCERKGKRWQGIKKPSHGINSSKGGGTPFPLTVFGKTLSPRADKIFTKSFTPAYYAKYDDKPGKAHTFIHIIWHLFNFYSWKWNNIPTRPSKLCGLCITHI